MGVAEETAVVAHPGQAACCSVLKCVSLWCSVFEGSNPKITCVLQCVAVCCSVFDGSTRSALLCAAVCSKVAHKIYDLLPHCVLQCVEVRCSAFLCA